MLTDGVIREYIQPYLASPQPASPPSPLQGERGVICLAVLWVVVLLYIVFVSVRDNIVARYLSPFAGN